MLLLAPHGVCGPYLLRQQFPFPGQRLLLSGLLAAQLLQAVVLPPQATLQDPLAPRQTADLLFGLLQLTVERRTLPLGLGDPRLQVADPLTQLAELFLVLLGAGRRIGREDPWRHAGGEQQGARQ